MDWVEVKEAARLLGVDESVFLADYVGAGKVCVKDIGGMKVRRSSLPIAPAEPKPAPPPLAPLPKSEAAPIDAAATMSAELYASAPAHARALADKYLVLFSESAGLAGRELEGFIARWNANNPDLTTSYTRLKSAQKAYNEGGIAAILGKYGKRRGASSVPDELFDYYKKLYLTEGRPSENSCYMYTVGYASRRGYDARKLPKAAAFARRLRNETPEHAIYMARNGAAATNRKYGFYIRRDYSDVLSGECWVSDHAQLDVAVTAKIEGREKTVFPWITVMRDFKSGRWVGWYLHADAPDSDDIFMAFHRAATAHGIPSCLYLDNGKDYRCLDFAGGRRSVKPGLDKARATSMCAALGITVQYAIPYNAQSKPVERDFLLLKEWFSKHNAGYRGGNPVEKPEGLWDNIKAGKILSIEDIEKHLDSFIESVTALPLSAQDWRKGKSELDIWNADYPVAIQRGLVKQVTDAALAMFCRRTSRVMTVGRRGIRDGELGVDYYDSWMEGQKGRKVYLRRDPKAMETAWVFDAQTDELINKAYLLPTAPALAHTDVQKDMLKQNMAIKRRSNKILRILADAGDDVPFGDKMDNLKEYAQIVRQKADEGQALPKPALLITNMDIGLAEQAKREVEGVQDLSAYGYDKETVPRQNQIFGLESELMEAYEAGNPAAVAIVEGRRNAV